MAIRSTKRKAEEADNNKDVTEVQGKVPATESTKTTSDDNVDAGEPVVADRSDVTEDGPGVKSAGVDPHQNEKASDEDGSDNDGGFAEFSRHADEQGGTSAETAQERDSSEDPSNVGDSVTNRSNDDATYKSNDAATGDNNTGEPSTKAGDAPVGVKSDRRVAETGEAPSTLGEAQVQSFAPAATLHNPKDTSAIAEQIVSMLKSFDGKTEDTVIQPTTNIFDEGLLERANVFDFAKKLADEFTIDISASEAQNWLLTRDVVNTVLRKLAKN